VLSYIKVFQSLERLSLKSVNEVSYIIDVKQNYILFENVVCMYMYYILCFFQHKDLNTSFTVCDDIYAQP
jgi:hypothetical protein